MDKKFNKRTNLLYYISCDVFDNIKIQTTNAGNKERIGMKSKREKKSKTINGKLKTQLGYYLMFIVPALWMFVFNYIPMAGTYLSLIDYKPAKGILGSTFIGFKNFIKFFNSMDFVRIFRNTILHNLASIFIVYLGCGILFALLLYEIKSRIGNKVFQTSMLLPSFLSWTVVSSALFMLLSPDRGLVNSILVSLGFERVKWYSEASYWPFIIVIARIYKDAGMSSIYFFAALLSIDNQLFDAAKLDGANRIQQIKYISLPAMSKIICLTMILKMGDILTAGISPYYELTLDQGALYETTQVIGTYIKNGLSGGNFSYTAAVGFTESIISTVLVVLTNTIVKKIDPDSAMF